MNHQPHPTHAERGRGVATSLAAAATGLAMALVGLTALPGAPAAATGAGGPIHCDRGICVKYAGKALIDADSDGDGFTDRDEKVAGTDPGDPGSHPAVLDLVDLVAAQRLPSFEERLSAVVVLPEALPDRTRATDEAGLESLTAALAGLAPTRGDGLSRLGISRDLLAELGVRGSDVLSIVAGASTRTGKPAFEGRIGGMRASWISAGEDAGTRSGVGVDTSTGGDGSVHKTVRWFEDTDAGAVSVTVEFEMCGQDCTGDFSVSVVGGGQDDECSTVGGVGCFGSLGEKADQAYDLMKKKEREDAGKATPAPAAPQPAGQPSSQPSQQPSDQPSEQPTDAPSEQPSGSATPSADGGAYTNPDADQAVVVTAADVERVVRIVRGSVTTPAQVDAGLPTLDPSGIGPAEDPYALRDPSYEASTFTTVSPVRTGEAVTNYGPHHGPRP